MRVRWMRKRVPIADCWERCALDEGSAGVEAEASPAIHLCVAVKVNDGVMARGVDISIATLQDAVVVDAVGAS